MAQASSSSISRRDKPGLLHPELWSPWSSPQIISWRAQILNTMRAGTGEEHLKLKSGPYLINLRSSLYKHAHKQKVIWRVGIKKKNMWVKTNVLWSLTFWKTKVKLYEKRRLRSGVWLYRPAGLAFGHCVLFVFGTSLPVKARTAS